MPDFKKCDASKRNVATEILSFDLEFFIGALLWNWAG